MKWKRINFNWKKKEERSNFKIKNAEFLNPFKECWCVVKVMKCWMAETFETMMTSPPTGVRLSTDYATSKKQLITRCLQFPQHWACKYIIMYRNIFPKKWQDFQMCDNVWTVQFLIICLQLYWSLICL